MTRPGAARLGGLDTLRAVSILLVLLHHAGEDLGASWFKALFMRLGGLGVLVFFVLSGFLITRLLLDEIDAQGRIDYLGFYRRRLARLMPAFLLYVALGVVLLTWRDKPLPVEAMQAALLYVINYYQAFHGAPSNWVSHCWSLAVEEQFYAVWPLALGALVLRRAGLARTLAIMIGAVWLLRTGLTLAGAPEAYLYRALETRADQMLIGALLAVLVRGGQAAQLARYTRSGWAVAGWVVVVWLSTLAGMRWPTYQFTFGYAIEPLVVALLVHWVVERSSGHDGVSRVLNQPQLVHAGRVSYGMYLFHGVFMHSVLMAALARTGSATLGVLAGCLVTFGFASVLFRVFEAPLQRWINAPGQALQTTEAVATRSSNKASAVRPFSE